MSVDVPIIRISQVTDDRWIELTDPPWMMSDDEIIRNQVTLEEVLQNADRSGNDGSGLA